MELAVTSNFSLFGGLFGGNGTITSITAHPDYFIYLDTGVKYKITSRLIVEGMLRENPAPGKGSTDVTFHLGLGCVFDR